MPQNFYDLDRLVHGNPCSESWDAMAGDDWVRHCDNCDQNVYNLSALTRIEAEALLRERGDSICTAFYRRPDGTLLTQRCPSSIRRSWAGLAAAAAGLGLAIPSWGQLSCPDSTADIKQKPGKGQSASINLVVADSTGAVIPEARVIFRQGESEQLYASNERGRVVLPDLAPGEYQLKVETEGFRSFEKSGLRFEATTLYEIAVTLQIGSLGGNAGIPQMDGSQHDSRRSLWRRIWAYWSPEPNA